MAQWGTICGGVTVDFHFKKPDDYHYNGTEKNNVFIIV